VDYVTQLEQTPTLGNAIPAFEAMAHAWEFHQVKNPEMAAIVNEGLEKLEEYRARTDFVPAYVLAMSLWLWLYFSPFLSVHIPFQLSIRL
jgi:hypothetical protein